MYAGVNSTLVSELQFQGSVNCDLCGYLLSILCLLTMFEKHVHFLLDQQNSVQRNQILFISSTSPLTNRDTPTNIWDTTKIIPHWRIELQILRRQHNHKDYFQPSAGIIILRKFRNKMRRIISITKQFNDKRNTNRRIW